MPNWCKNHLTITGPDDALDAFTERCHESATRTNAEYLLTFETFLPTPESAHERAMTGFIGRDTHGNWREAKAFFHSDGSITWDDAGELSDVAERKYRVTRVGGIVVPDGEDGGSRSGEHGNLWGVKWNAGEVNWERVDVDEIDIQFFTPWSPPTRVIRAMQELIRPLGLVARLRSVTEGSSTVDLLLEDGSEATEDDVEVEDEESHDSHIA